MNCHECEELILDSLDSSAPPDRRAELEAHVAACPACCGFQRSQAQLDAALAKSIQRASLSPGFGAQVLRQVDDELARGAAPSIEARRRAAEAEYAERLAGLGEGRLGDRVLRGLEVIGLGVAGLLGGLVLSAWLPRLAQVRLPGLPASWQGAVTYVPWAAAALMAGAALALSVRRDLLTRLTR